MSSRLRQKLYEYIDPEKISCQILRSLPVALSEMQRLATRGAEIGLKESLEKLVLSTKVGNTHNSLWNA